MKCASDFIGDALGTSEKRTQAILKAAESNVLVIDEAYSLAGGFGYGVQMTPTRLRSLTRLSKRFKQSPVPI